MSSPRSFAQRFAIGGSALLLVVTCLLWARSTLYKETVSHWREIEVAPGQQLVAGHAHWRNVVIELDRGAVYVQRGTYAYGSTPQLGFTRSSMPVAYELFLCSPASPDVHVAAAGFSFSRWNRFPTWRNAAIRVPLWSIALISAVMPGLGFVNAVRRRRRYGEGMCARCGYDLRATPQRCPECGLVPGESRRPGRASMAA